jgi:hypothetical protein
MLQIFLLYGFTPRTVNDNNHFQKLQQRHLPGYPDDVRSLRVCCN